MIPSRVRRAALMGLAALLALCHPRESSAGAKSLPVGTPAPEIRGTTWLNVAKGKEPALAKLRGGLVLLEFFDPG